MENLEPVNLVFEDESTALVYAVVLDTERKVTKRRLEVSVDDLASQAASLARELRSKVTALAADEMSMKVKLGVAIEAGKAIALFADGRVEGAIEVTFTWKS